MLATPVEDNQLSDYAHTPPEKDTDKNK
jgi:hypothetical protein